MQIWIDIYPCFPPNDKRVREFSEFLVKENGYYVYEHYKWRIVIDNDRFVVVNNKKDIVDYNPYCVILRDNILYVSDIPTRSVVNQVNSSGKANEVIRINGNCIDILYSGGWYKHVIYLNGFIVFKKIPFSHYTPDIHTCKYIYNIFKLYDIIYYKFLDKIKIKNIVERL